MTVDLSDTEQISKAANRQPRVAAIVLNYNGKDITMQAVGSLRQMSYQNCEILVVDNGSSDGSCEAIADAYPDVQHVRIEENVGPARGMNRGIQAAMSGDYDYLLLLNNDIEVHPEMLTHLVRVVEQDPLIGCAGPKGYYYSDRNRIWSAGGIIRFKESVTRERGMGALDQGQYDQDEEVPYISGCAVIIRRAAIEAAGLWDPVYELDVLDADWCMRMKQEGFKCWYAHKAVLWHMVARTLGSCAPKRTYQTGRSSAIFVRRYGSLWNWCTFIMFSAAAVPYVYVRELKKGNQSTALAKLRGIIEGMRVPLGAPPKLN